MNKSLTMIYEDFKQELANLINNSGLPASIIESVLRVYLVETSDIAKRQYQMDKAQYEKALLEKPEE